MRTRLPSVTQDLAAPFGARRDVVVVDPDVLVQGLELARQLLDEV
jgi:hypothetical protein